MKKKIGIISILLFIAIVCIAAGVLFGAFEHYDLPAYENYYVLGGNCYSAGNSLEPMKVFQEKAIPDGVEVSDPATEPDIKLDLDKLDTTAYYALAEYCEANDYAVDEYRIANDIQNSDHAYDQIEELGKETEPKYRMIDGKLYVRCIVLGTCLDYGMQDDGMTWQECEKEGYWGFEHPPIPWFDFVGSERGDIGEVIPILTSPLSLKDPANTCYVCLTLYVCIEEKQTAGEDGSVTMSAALTEDNSTTLVCTIVNKTEKDIEIGEEYHLQVLKDEAFVDVPLSPEIGFNLLSRDILSGNEYSYRVDIEHNHGDLESGRYRIVKEYTNKEKDSQKKENASKETVSAEFDLP